VKSGVVVWSASHFRVTAAAVEDAFGNPDPHRIFLPSFRWTQIIDDEPRRSAGGKRDARDWEERERARRANDRDNDRRPTPQVIRN